jgi:hypothetical protein
LFIAHENQFTILYGFNILTPPVHDAFIFSRNCSQISEVKKTAIVFSCFLFSFISFAQTDTSSSDNCKLRVSLLTCTPGTELYSTFGHSALRVVDSLSGVDIIYNYGTFDFDDPDFYTKFVRGKLLYFVSVDEFANFMAQYQYEQRGITEQNLDLSCTEKEKFVAALVENAKEKNKYYKYDFVYDNCTTRLRDMVTAAAANPVSTKNIIPARTTFRDLIHEYLNRSGQYWSKFGIDILLGVPVDKKISNKEAMFLPDYLLKGFDSTTVGQKKLVNEKKIILDTRLKFSNKMFFTPLVAFSILFLLIATLSFFPSTKFIRIFLNVFDKIFFFLCGILGVLMLFMWFGTDHPPCTDNFNLFWALPIHLVILAVPNWRKNWIRNYFKIIFWLMAAFLLCWSFLPQQLNNALLPVIGIILIRSYFISKRI